MLVDGGDAVSEDRFDLVLDRGVDRCSQVAAGQAGEVVADHAVKDVDVDVGFDLATGTHGAKVFNLVPDGADRVFDAHPFGHLVADAPEVDHVAAGAELRRLSITVGVWPVRYSQWASAAPATPAPLIATCIVQLCPMA